MKPNVDYSKIRYVLSDLDETAITRVSWHMLLKACGIDPGPINERYFGLLKQAEPEEQDKLLERWVQENAEQLAGKRADVKIEIPYTPGVVDFFRDLSNDYVTGLVAGGCSTIGYKVMNHLLLDENHCNIVYVDDRGIFLPQSFCRTRWNDKLKYIERNILEESEKVSENVIFIGDGENDVGPLEAAALGIAICPKTKNLDKRVRKAADLIVPDFNEARKYLKERGIIFDRTRYNKEKFL